MQFALKGKLNMNLLFELMEYLSQENDYIPWYNAQFIFKFLNYHLSNTQAFNSLKVNIYLRKNINIYNNLRY